MNLHDALKKHFGYDHFRPGQQAIVENVLRGQDTIGLLPTGMGKSLCYQLPGYLMEGTVLIISPLVSLMEDQVMQMKRNGEKRVIALNSSLVHEQRQKAFRQLADYKFIFTSPEMLSQSFIVDVFKEMNLALIVIDEAHCISQWGFDFRPDYLRIREFLSSINRPVVLALTATADQKVLEDIPVYLQMINPIIERQSLDRPNIAYSVVQLESVADKTEWIKRRLLSTTGPGIVYAPSRKRADELAIILQSIGVHAQSYHAGKEQDDRSIIQDQFLNGEIDWVCATNAFGMGVHKENVRQVIHDQLPATIAGYIQEVGRAGRDGRQSVATLLYTPADERLTNFIIQTDLPSEEEVIHYAKLLEKGETQINAARFSGLTDTALRVIEYYRERCSTEEIIQKFKMLAIQKDEQLKKMLALVHSSTCLRRTILAFFNENSVTNSRDCCSVCGLSDMEWLANIVQKDELQAKQRWDERITSLLT